MHDQHHSPNLPSIEVSEASLANPSGYAGRPSFDGGASHLGADRSAWPQFDLHCDYGSMFEELDLGPCDVTVHDPGARGRWIAADEDDATSLAEVR